MVCCLVLRRLVCLVVSLSRLFVLVLSDSSDGVCVCLIFLVSCLVSFVSFYTSTFLHQICSSIEIVACGTLTLRCSMSSQSVKAIKELGPGIFLVPERVRTASLPFCESTTCPSSVEHMRRTYAAIRKWTRPCLPLM
jgi:hypothetical protein